jgi:protein-disulfide isomerase
MWKLSSVAVLALLSLSPPQSRDAEIDALKREIAQLRAQQAQMQRDLQAIMQLLQQIARPQQPAGPPEIPGLIGAMIPTAGEPVLGSQSARVMVAEISDYHCPFCRRNVVQTFPQLEAEFIRSGRAAYTFIDYPIAQLHPDAARSHAAAACAGDQGKFWEMHRSLFATPPVKDVAGLTAKAKEVGLDPQAFTACLTGGKHDGAIQASVQRMEQLGIQGTPMTVIGIAPAPGQPMKVVKYVYGAQPYAAFKDAIEEVLAQAK